MDNASYHKPRDFDWITPYKMCKMECTSFLKSQGVREFTVDRNGTSTSFRQNTWNLNARDRLAPSLKELQAAVKAHLKLHPDINKTKVDKLLLPHGHSIVWTPPFVPEVQPIELIWAHVKLQVAAQYTLKRTIEMTRQQTDDAFDTITTTMIQTRIDHCHRWIDAFMQTDEAGSLRQYGTLDNLIAARSQVPIPSDIDAAGVDEAEENEAAA